MTRTLFRAAPVALLAAFAALAGAAAQANARPPAATYLTLPAPTGPHAVGVTAIRLVDTSRVDPFAPTPNHARRYGDCMQLARREPLKALPLAEKWKAEGGGLGARHCVAVAMFEAGKYVRVPLRLRLDAAVDVAKSRVIVVPLEAKESERALKLASTRTSAVAIEPCPAGET